MSVKIANQEIKSPDPTVPVGWTLIGRLPLEDSLSELHIDQPTVLIGRRSDSDVCLKSKRVSGRHAELLFAGEHLFIRDLNSTNGTFLNRKRVSQPMPVVSGDHIELADIEFRVQHVKPKMKIEGDSLFDLKKTISDLNTIDADWILSQFDELIFQQGITPHFQTIVDFQSKSIVGLEALARSAMPGLENPGKMFQTAELVNQEVELSVLCRAKAIEFAKRLDFQVPIFLNTHPHEDMAEDILPSIQSLQQRFSGIPIVIEFHEKTIQSAETMLEYKAMLGDIGVKIAYDDFGAGQSRLLELMKAPPHYLKFDRCLIKDIHEATPYHSRMLRSLIDTAHDAGIATLAEGVETQEEADACQDFGFQLAQGYYYGYPKANPFLNQEDSMLEFSS